MAFLTMAAKLIWLTVLFLAGCTVAMILIVSGFTTMVKLIEEIKEDD